MYFWATDTLEDDEWRGAVPDFDETVLSVALSLAIRAPSIHNTQPWRWRIAPQRVDLYADPARRLDQLWCCVASPARRPG
jgi:nitroreductase